MGDPSASRTTNGRTPRPGDTADEAYLRLRELIVEGAFEPEQRLPQARLMELLEVGRTPLRNALSRLQSDGLVIATPNHGVAVAPVPVSSAEEIYTMRFVVEPPLLEATAEACDEAHLARLREGLAAMDDALGDPSAFAVAHRAFHAVQREAFTSPFIEGLVADMYRHLQRHLRVRLIRSQTPADFLHLDRETVEALASGDAVRARRTLEFHLVDAAISFLAAADPEHRPTLLLAVTRANGMRVELDGDGAIRLPARVTWATPCRSLPPLETPFLVHDPSRRR